MDNYYIYIYLDPRKYGYYKYGEYKFDYEPFYVGKGKNDRCKIYYNRNKYFKNKINKIIRCGLKPIIFKLYENLNENKSFEFEKKLIKEIGRIDLKTGSLINMTDGGEGTSGISEEERSKISERMKGENNPFFGKHHTEETKRILRKNFQEIKEEFEKRNYKLLTEEKDYKNSKQKLNYICPNGHKGFIRWNDFQQGKGCKICKYELLSENQRKNFDEIKKEFENRDYRLLTKEKEYKNNKQKLDYICPKGHNGLIDWSHFHRGQGCTNNICLIKNKL
jgi:hypothetical protein